MPVINLLNETATGKSIDQNSANLINLYLTEDQDQGKFSTAAYYTPGLTVFSNIASPVRALFSFHGTLYAVGGNTLYSITSGGVATTRGVLNSSSGFCKIRAINAQLLIIDSTTGYYYTIATNTFGIIPNSSAGQLVQTVTVLTHGQNYTAPTVAFSGGGGAGAAATANISGGVTSATVTAGGSLYTNLPAVTFTDNAGQGSGATGAAVVQGSVTSINVLSSGTGYLSAPTVVITDSSGTGSGATATAVLTAGVVSSVTVNTGGSNYNILTTTISFTGGSGSGASAVAFFVGSVTAITINTPGSGYSTSVSVAFSGGGGTGATATATVSKVVNTITVTATGTGYTSLPTVTINDSTGTGATATAQTSTSAFPLNPIDIECQDEFGLVLYPNSQTFASSAISNLAVWPNLSFASTTGNYQNLVAIISLFRQPFLMQEQTTEVWENGGLPNFTFQRNQSYYMEYGCAATLSVAKGNNTCYFLGRAPSGGNVVVTIHNGYSPLIISNRAINYQISTYATVSDAVGFVYQQEGHEFYVLTFPTQGVTWVYDISTAQWHQRQSTVGGLQTRWLPSCYTFCYNTNLVGDYQSGNIYTLDMNNYTENGTSIVRTLISHPFFGQSQWIFLDRVELYFDNTPDTSSSNIINLSISRDGGNTFGTAKPQSAQGAGLTSYGPRIYWNRLGIAKTFVVKLQTSMNAKYIILGATAIVRGETATTQSSPGTGGLQ